MIFGISMSRNTKTEKKAKPRKSSKKLVTKKTASPDYVKIKGQLYEKISSTSKEVELDLAEDVLNLIDRHIDSGKYVSRGDAIRDILRRAIESEKGLE